MIAAGCGGGDDNKPSGGGGSYAALANQIAHPTGTLAASNATAVADAYAKEKGLGTAGGRRLESTSAAGSQQACPAGGNLTVNVDSRSQSSAHVTETLNNCCYTAGCCSSGSADMYYSGGSAASGQYCMNFNLTATCGGQTAIAEKFSYCINGGKMQFLVTVDGKSFAVSGSYGNGSGSLEITSANGTFSCTYSSNGGTVTGSCTGSGTFNF
jgi:hypothetical protein